MSQLTKKRPAWVNQTSSAEHELYERVARVDTVLELIEYRSRSRILFGTLFLLAAATVLVGCAFR